MLNRWNAVIHYRTGPEEYLEVEHTIEELHELHDLVERGPDWDTISEIRITRIPLAGREGLTVEQAALE